MESLNWESSYAVARTLKDQHPDVELQDISLEMIFEWTLAIPNFDDDPELANEEILLRIYQDWLEEVLEKQEPN